MRITIKKSRMIEKIVKAGFVAMSAYCYKLNEAGEIEKAHFGSSKREIYATAEEVAAVIEANKHKIY